MTYQQMTAASVPIVLEDGTTYQFSPLSDRDLAELDAWLQSKVIQIARQSLTPDLSQKERDETLSLAMREASNVSFLTKAGQTQLATISGMVHLLWMSIRKNHPDVSEDTLQSKLMENIDNIRIITDKFREVNKVYARRNGASNSGNSQKKKRRRILKKK